MKITIHFSSMAFVPNHTHVYCALGYVSQVWMKYINGMVGRMWHWIEYWMVWPVGNGWKKS